MNQKLCIDYLKMLDENDVPSNDENKSLIKKAIEGDDGDAWNLAIRNCRFAYKCVGYLINSEYSDSLVNNNDIFGLALTGFFISIKRLRVDCSIPEFLTYSSYWIKQHTLSRLNSRINSVGNINNKVEIFSLDKGLDDYSHRNIEFDADIIGKVDVVLASKSFSNFIDLLAKKEKPSNYKRKGNKKISLFTDNEISIIKHIYAKNDNMAEIAKEMGVSRERVRVIKDKVREKIIREIKSDKFLMTELEKTLGKNVGYLDKYIVRESEI